MTHPADMRAWAEIACQQGHETHAVKLVDVSVGGPTPYHDYPLIPERFARRFKMYVYDWARYRDGVGYCPAHDAVSETIDTIGVWEPAETTLVLAACSAPKPLRFFVDFGSQLGWFSLLAASCGLDVVCYEADPANIEVMLASFAANGWPPPQVIPGRVGPETAVIDMLDLEGIAVAKIDLEGAEPDAVRVIWPLIDAGKVDNLLVEVSPVFHDGYPDLVAHLVEAGYSVHPLPEKRPIPERFDVFPDDLGLDFGALGAGGLRNEVASWDQKNVWFTRDEAAW